MIGVMTTIIADVATIFGCLIHMDDTITGRVYRNSVCIEIPEVYTNETVFLMTFVNSYHHCCTGDDFT